MLGLVAVALGVVMVLILLVEIASTGNLSQQHPEIDTGSGEDEHEKRDIITTEGPLKHPKLPKTQDSVGNIKPSELLLRGKTAGNDQPRRKKGANQHPPLIKDKLTLVLCTWSGDTEGFPRVEMLFSSVSKFLSKKSLHELLLVVPDGDFPHFKQEFQQRTVGFPVRLVADERLKTLEKEEMLSLTPKGELKENGGRGANYRMQMLLKLLISKEVQTAFYITLDNDVFFKRPTEFSDLIINGKAIVQGREAGRHRASWWSASGTILQNPHDCGSSLVRDPFQIGVTPAILHTHATRSLISTIEARNGTFDRILFQYLSNKGTADWTEYTLYWSFICVKNYGEVLHTHLPDRRLYDTSGFAWSSFDSYDVDAVFKDNSTFFGVVQSISGAPSADVIKALSPRFV
eukprot:TRINITY_DN10166_c7_g1_i1.p1 TRINITY_DN10166_c7_g1~~TRINITY_DN10166_c7_g1_i1.p1  ORF type:complete len:444 (+),score=41.34 TRINITY_DN10166_c7_g1_i1:124-1332(+)